MRGRRDSRLGQSVRAGALAGVWSLRTAALLLFFVPMGLVIYLSFGRDAYSLIPPSGYSFKWYANIANEPEFLSGFLVSVQIAAIVTVAALIAGTLAAYAEWRYKLLPGRVMEIVLTLPILVPTVVTGIALLILFSRLHSYVAFWNIAVGHLIIALPFTVRAVAVALSRYNRQLDEAALGLGAHPVRVFLRITLPQIRSGIFAGGLFAFIVSFDEFSITIFLINADTIPLPVAIYHYIQWNMDPTLSAASAVLILMTIAAAVLIDRLVGLDRFVGLRD